MLESKQCINKQESDSISFQPLVYLYHEHQCFSSSYNCHYVSNFKLLESMILLHVIMYLKKSCIHDQDFAPISTAVHVYHMYNCFYKFIMS